MKGKFEEIITKYVPVKAVSYCASLWDSYKFNFKVSKSRRSKLGDYKYLQDKKQHYISVNGSLNPYAFLITYLHEVAHLQHQIKKGRNNPPHGNEWKNSFIHLMEPMLNTDIFPEDVLKVLNRHMLNPKASSQSDIQLVRVLAKYNDSNNSELTLDKINSGELFELNNKIFRKIEKKRTRSVCIDIKSGRRYLVSEIAPVRKCS